MAGRDCNDLKSILPQTQPWDQAVDYEELCLAFHTLVNPAINDHPLLLCWCFLLCDYSRLMQLQI
jgi:hypothetical protein